MASSCRCLNCIVPPHMLRKLSESKVKEIREAAMKTLMTSTGMRALRQANVLSAVGGAVGSGRRTIFDCGHKTEATATVARHENGPASADDTVNRAFDGFGKTRDFYSQVFGRNSIDDKGMRIDGYVHYGESYENAGWNGQIMIFGDGDGQRFGDFTKSLDVIAHELAHGVTQATADLYYHMEPGALNESMSDVFGSLVKQWSLGQSADEADWLIGAEVLTPEIGADALRSMKAPGTAYNNELLGPDPQPDHMSRWVAMADDAWNDNGGVHINSGIPNKAFYLAATGIGGHAWEAPGQIWYSALRASVQTTNFQEFADTTFSKAGELFGAGGVEQQAVQSAWRDVGIRITGSLVAGTRPRGRAPSVRERDADGLGALTKQVEALAAQLKVLAKEVGTLKRG